MPDDNIPSRKYRDAGIPWYFMTSSIVDNFCKNPTVRIVCSALADSLSNNCVLMMLMCEPSASRRGCHVAGIYVGVLMYADDLLLISSTCSDLRIECCGRYLASPRYIIP